MTTERDITNEVHAAMDADLGDENTDPQDLLGEADDQTEPEPAANFADQLKVYAGMNGDMLDAIFADVHDLAALNPARRADLFKFLKEHGESEAAIIELQSAIAKAGKRKTNKAEPGPKVSERIAGDLAKWGYDLWLNDMDDSVWDGDHLLTDAQRATLRMIARDNGYAEERLLTALDLSLIHI